MNTMWFKKAISVLLMIAIILPTVAFAETEVEIYDAEEVLEAILSGEAVYFEDGEIVQASQVDEIVPEIGEGYLDEETGLFVEGSVSLEDVTEDEEIPAEGEDVPVEGEDIPAEDEDLALEDVTLPELRVDPMMDVPVMPDGTARLEVFALCDTMEIAYQWQMLDEAAFYAENPEAVEGDEAWEAAWADIEGATEAVMALENIDVTDTAAWQQVVYRCAVQAGEAMACTNAVRLFLAMPEVSMNAVAAAETDGDFTYRIETDANGLTTATITGYNGTNMDVVIPATIGGYAVTAIYNSAFYGDKITSVVIPEGVVSINQYAFYNCDSLTSVAMPSTLRTIGSNAFYDCDGLETIVIPEGVTSVEGYVFYDCDKLANITLPSTLKEIGTGMFEYCDSLVEITIPEGVEAICGYAFYSCDALTTVHFPETLKTIREDAFYDSDKLVSVSLPDALETIEQLAFQSCDALTTVEFGSGLKTIGYGVFNACYKLANVNIPVSIESIGEDAFRYCREMKMDLVLPKTLTTLGEEAFCDTGITAVSIPASIGEIPYGAFSSCDNLTSVTIASGITAIARYAFNGNDALTEIVIPDSVTSIGEYAFYDCDGLLSLDMGNGVKTIGSNAFSSCGSLAQVDFSASLESIGSSAFSSCGSLKTDIVLPETLTAIGTSAFYGSGITGVTVPGSLKVIPDHAFYDCDNLTKVVFTSGLESIGEYAFCGCEALENIAFPAGLTSIGRYAFSSCRALASVELPEGLTEIAESAFSGCDSLKSVVVPDSVITLANNVFYDCDSLTHAKLPEGLATIPGSLFYDCDALVSVDLPDSLTCIGTYAFYSCNALTSFTVPEGVTQIMGNALAYCKALTVVTLPEGLKVIDGSAFYECDKLESVNFPSTLETIERYAFYSCEALKSVIIPDGVTTLGERVFNDCSALESATIGAGVTVIPDGAFSYCTSLKSVIIPGGVTSIGRNAFYNCKAMQSITLPESVTGIGDGAFSYCEALTSIAIPSGVTGIGDGAFSYCEALATVTLPEGLTEIADEAFYDCDALASINLPKNLTSIGYRAFAHCDSLKSIVIPDSVTNMGQDTFAYCDALESVTIGAGVAKLPRCAFEDCVSLKSIEIPNTVTEVDAYVFSDCDALKSVVIPDSVTVLGADLFYDCAALESVTIGAGVTSIPYGGFANCASLKSITIPENVTKIEGYAFSGCDALQSIAIPASVTEIGYNSFYDCDALETAVIEASITKLPYYTFCGCDSLKKVVLPEMLTTIEYEAFEYCASLEEINIPAGVTSIGSSAFYGCASLADITLPESVTNIGSSAFYGCTSLAEITIPEGVTTIERSTFSDCTSLVEITIPTNVTIIDDYAFAQCASLTAITLPERITDIGYSVFYNCDALETAVIESAITKLPYRMFESCDSLKKVALPETLTTIEYEAFEYCASLEEINIPASVNSIGENAFNGCTSLAEITIPENVTRISDYAFRDCTSLKSVELPESLTEIGYCVFYNCSGLAEITIPGSVTTIEGYAFSGCTSLAEITIPGNVTTIEGAAFADCTSLTEITIPENVTTIEGSAFAGCTSLAEITIPGNVTTIEGSAFAGCTSLTDITWPDGITHIGYHAFYDCDSLEHVILPADLETLEGWAFAYCDNLKTLELPLDLTYFDASAVAYCPSLKEITIPLAVEEIYDGYYYLYDKTLVVYPGSYAEEYAIDNGLTYRHVGAEGGELTVQFPESDEWADYAGLNLTITWNGGKATRVLGGDTEYRFSGFGSASSCALSIANSYGDVVYKNDYISLNGEETVLEIKDMPVLCTVNFTVINDDYQTLNDWLMVEWRDADGNVYANEARLTGLPEGKALTARVRLTERLGKLYKAPADFSWTTSASSENAYLTLEAFKKITLTGTVKVGDEPYAAAAVSAVQMLNGQFKVTHTALTDAQGAFTMEINAGADAVVSVEAYGYKADPVNVSAANANIAMKAIGLEMLDGATAKITAYYTESAAPGETAVSRYLSSWNDLEFEVYNNTTGRSVDHLRQSGELVMPVGVSAGDSLTITVSSLSGDFKPVSAKCTMDDDLEAECEMQIKQYGSLDVAFAESGNKANRLIVFNENGSRAWTGLFERNFAYSNVLPDGEYTVVAMGNSAFFTNPSRLSVLADAGLVEGTDYVKETAKIASGSIAQVTFESVPALDETKLYYTEQESTIFNLSKSKMNVGSYFSIKAKTAFKDEVADSVSNVKWIIEIPENCAYYENTLSLNGKLCSDYILERDRMIVPVANAGDTLRLCLMGVEDGNTVVSGYLEFDLDGKTIRQPVGTGIVKIGLLEIEVPNRTNDVMVTASGQANPDADVYLYDNETLVGQTKVNAAGKWRIDFELVKPYTYTSHEIYARIVTVGGMNVRTETKELIYQYAESPVRLSKVTMVNYNHENDGKVVFDFINPSDSMPAIIYWPSYPSFSFVVEFEGEELDRISNVVLTVERENGTTIDLYPVWNDAANGWVVSENFYSSALPVSVEVGYDFDSKIVISSDEIEQEKVFWENFEFVEEDVSDEGIESIDFSVFAQSDPDYYTTLIEAKQEIIKCGELEELIQKAVGELGEITFNDSGISISGDAYDISFKVENAGTLSEKELENLGFEKTTTSSGEPMYTKLESEPSQGTGTGNTGSSSGNSGGNVKENVTQEVYDPVSKTLTRTVVENYDPGKAELSVQNLQTNLTGAYQIATSLGINKVAGDGGYEYQKAGKATKSAIKAGEDSIKAADALIADYEAKLRDAIIYGSDDDIEAAQKSLQEQKEYKQKLEKAQNSLSKELDDIALKSKAAAKTLAKWTGVGAALDIASGIAAYNEWGNKSKELEKYRTQLENDYKAGLIDKATYEKQLKELEAAADDIMQGKGTGVMSVINGIIGVATCVALVAGVAASSPVIAAAGVVTLVGGIACTIYDCILQNRFAKRLFNFKKRRSNIGYSNKFGGGKVPNIHDPSGYVYEAVASNRLEGVKATCYEKYTAYDIYDEPYEVIEIWDAVPFEQINPQMTDKDGQYRWDVPEGKWQVKYEKEGYQTAYSEWLDVPPPQLEVNEGLISYAAPTVESVKATKNGVEVKFSKYMQVDRLTADYITVKANGAALSGKIELLDEEANPLNENETFASKLRFVPDTAQAAGTEYSVSVSSNVLSYAGVRMSKNYSGSTKSVVEPESIEVSEKVLVESGKSLNVAFKALPANVTKGMTVKVVSGTSMLFDVDKTEVVLDENGSGTITVSGKIPGESVVRFEMMDGNITAELRVNVVNPGQLDCKHENVEIMERWENITATNTGSADVHHVKGDRVWYLQCADCASQPEMTFNNVAYPWTEAFEQDAAHEMTDDTCTLCGYSWYIGSIKLPDTITLGLKEKRMVNAQILPEGAEEKVTYSVASTKIATVDANGQITAKKTGSTTLTVASESGVKATCTIKVVKAPTSVKASPQKVTIGVGETVKIGGTLSKGSASVLSFKSAKTSVATVDADGNVTGVKAGTAKITVSAFNGKKATCTVTVKAAPASITLTPAMTTMAVKQKSTFSVALSSGSAGAYKVESLNPAILSVDEKGNMTALGEGTAVIRAKTYNNLTSEKTITILPEPTELSLNTTAWTLGVGEKLTIQPSVDEGSQSNYTFKSSKSSVASVSSKGVVTAKKKGTAKITVKTHNDLEAVCTITVKTAPKSVKLSKTKLTLGVGEPAALTAKLTSGTASRLTWTSSNANVVRVDENGNLSAVGVGKATVTVKTFNKKSAKCTVTVSSAPESLTLAASRQVMSVGQTAKLTTTLSTGSAGAYSYSAVPEGIVTIDGSSIKAIKDGKVTVTATAYNGVKASVDLDVKVAPDKVVLEQSEITLGVKETITLNPTIANGSPADITYSTSKKSVATVNASGKITAKKAGTAYITVKPHAGESVKVKVVVKAAPKSVKLNKTKLTLGLNEEFTLAATLTQKSVSKLTWASSNASVVTVDANGNLVAVGIGKATVTVRTFNKKTAQCVVTVTNAPTSIALSADKNTMSVGQTAKLTAVLSDGSAGAYSYSVQPEGIVTIDGSTVKAVKDGKVKVTATAYNGVNASVELDVKVAPDKVVIDQSAITLGVKETLTLSPVIANGSPADITYSSSKKTVATVNASGKITAKKTGTAYITVKPHAGESVKVKVVVKAAPKSVKMSSAKLNLAVGETAALTAKLTSNTASAIVWQSSDSAVVTVDAAGNLTAVGEGTATITATTFNKKKASCTVIVSAAEPGIPG